MSEPSGPKSLAKLRTQLAAVDSGRDIGADADSYADSNGRGT